MKSTLPEAVIKGLCMFQHGPATCSFLMMGPEGLCCAKGTGFQPMIEKRRAEKSMVAMGDNCAGPPEYVPLEAGS